MKDIIDSIDARIKSPLFGYFIFSLFALNWEAIFYLLVDISSVSERIEYFHENTDSLSLLLYPFLLAAAYSVIYPWIHFVFIFLGTKPTELQNSLQAQSEHKLLTKRKELEEARTQILESAETELIARARRDEKLVEIEDQEVRQKLQSEIEKLRNERDAIRLTLDQKENPKKQLLDQDQEEILRQITSNGGTIMEIEIIEVARFDKVKTEYLLEDLEENGYLSKDYDQDVGGYYYDLTTKSKKLMVEKGVVK